MLSDLAQSGLVYRAGRGDAARYRIADDTDVIAEDGAVGTAHEHLVWLAVYRNGPISEEGIRAWTHLGKTVCKPILESLIREGRIIESRSSAGITYSADRFEVPIGASIGWEAAVLDHFQAVVTAIIAKLGRGPVRGPDADFVGGSTWSLDVWPGHPLESEAKTLLRQVRKMVEEVRIRIDEHNDAHPNGGPRERVVFYAGQNIREASPMSREGEIESDDDNDA